MVGGLLVIASAFLPWLGDDDTPLGLEESTPAFSNELPFVSLFDFAGRGTVESFFSIGLVLMLLGVIALILSFAAGARVGRVLIGVLLIAICGLFVIRVIRSLSDLGGSGAFFNVTGLGVYLALVGGVLIVLGRTSRAA
jgi:hypothetical protein